MADLSDEQETCQNQLPVPVWTEINVWACFAGVGGGRGCFEAEQNPEKFTQTGRRGFTPVRMEMSHFVQHFSQLHMRAITYFIGLGV